MQELREASFRGVPFFIKQADTKLGRRTQIHEYPLRDKPFVEDLGRMARSFSLDGFVVGDRYLDDWRRLQAAFEKEGPGELIHPHFGRLIVNVTSGVTVSFSTARGTAEFSITFTESGELEFPSSSTDTKRKTIESASRLRSAAIAQFIEKYNLTSAQDFIRSAVAENVKAFFGDSLVQLSGVIVDADAAARIPDTALTLASGDSAAFAHILMDALGLDDISRTTASWRAVVAKSRNLAGDDRLNSTESRRHPAGSAERLMAESTEAFNEYVRNIEIHNAVLATTHIATKYDRINESEPVKAMSFDEIVELRDGLLETIDAEQLKTESDAVFQALSDCRASVWEDLSDRAENSAKLFEYEPAETMPALVLAYDVYEDARRDLEIVERNHIPRGGFLPTRPLKLLSK